MENSRQNTRFKWRNAKALEAAVEKGNIKADGSIEAGLPIKTGYMSGMDITIQDIFGDTEKFFGILEITGMYSFYGLCKYTKRYSTYCQFEFVGFINNEVKCYAKQIDVTSTIYSIANDATKLSA